MRNIPTEAEVRAALNGYRGSMVHAAMALGLIKQRHILRAVSRLLDLILRYHIDYWNEYS